MSILRLALHRSSGIPIAFLPKTPWKLPSGTACNVSVPFQFLLPSFSCLPRIAAGNAENPLKMRENRIGAAPPGLSAAGAGNPEGALILPAGIKITDGTGAPARGASHALVRIAAMRL
jgi:hypothetical protein